MLQSLVVWPFPVVSGPPTQTRRFRCETKRFLRAIYFGPSQRSLKPCETTAKYEFKLYFKSAQEKSFVGCRAGAATESRPYRCFHCCGAALMAGEPNIEAQFVLQVSDFYSPKICPFSESGL